MTRIASAVSNIPHIAGFDDLAKHRFNAADIGQILVNMYDTVDARLLDILADQLDMKGYNGWILAETDQQKRELLKAANGLKKFIGTPGAIREVVKRLGFIDIEIEEGWDNFTDHPEGMAEPLNSWAYFRVKYVLGNDRQITEELAQHLVGLINNYKPERSRMLDFTFKSIQEDRARMRGEVLLKIINNTTNAVISEEIIPNRIEISGLKTAIFRMSPIYDVPPGAATNLHNRKINSVKFGTNGTSYDLFEHEFYPIINPFRVPIPGTDWNGMNDRLSIVRQEQGFDTFSIRVSYPFVLAASQNNGATIKELGLIMEDPANLEAEDPFNASIFARIIHPGIVKTSNIRIEGEWRIYWVANYDRFTPA